MVKIEINVIKENTVIPTMSMFDNVDIQCHVAFVDPLKLMHKNFAAFPKSWFPWQPLLNH